MADFPYANISTIDSSAETLVLSAIPVIGDYRNPCFEWLVKAACRIIYKRRFDQSSRKRPMFGGCCKCWGTKAELLAKNHPCELFQEGKKLKLGESVILNEQELLSQITGPPPLDENEPWMVQLPRLAVSCLHSSRDVTNSEEQCIPKMQLTFLDSDKRNSAKEASLGKRDQATSPTMSAAKPNKMISKSDSNPMLPEPEQKRKRRMQNRGTMTEPEKQRPLSPAREQVEEQVAGLIELYGAQRVLSALKTPQMTATLWQPYLHSGDEESQDQGRANKMVQKDKHQPWKLLQPSMNQRKNKCQRY